jgi:hypothetical protein
MLSSVDYTATVQTHSLPGRHTPHPARPDVPGGKGSLMADFDTAEFRANRFSRNRQDLSCRHARV